jgi:hypothetical protein
MSADDLGTRGELICRMLLSEYCGRGRPYFVLHFLGDKFRTFDLLVELKDASGFFFVQVKTTQRGYKTDRNGQRKLRVSVSRADLQRMQNYPAPAYVIGVDEPNGIGYIVSANGDCPAVMGAMPINHPLDCTTLGSLWQEVEAYWSGQRMVLPASRFGV